MNQQPFDLVSDVVTHCPHFSELFKVEKKATRMALVDIILVFILSSLNMYWSKSVLRTLQDIFDGTFRENNYWFSKMELSAKIVND